MRAAGIDLRLAPVVNLATQPIPSGLNQFGGIGAGYQSTYYGGDSTPTTVAAGGDGPVAYGVALAYARKTIKTAGVSPARLVWMFTAANNDDMTAAPNAGNTLPIEPGHTYRICYHYRLTTAAPLTNAMTLYMRTYDAMGAVTGAAVIAVGSAEAPIVNGVWTRFSATVTIPTGSAVGLAIRERAFTSAGGLTIGDTSDVTALIITDVTDRPAHDEPYFDGGTPGARWLGTPNASPSVRWPASI